MCLAAPTAPVLQGLAGARPGAMLVYPHEESKVRVIAGKARGRRLYAVPGKGTRPVTDRVKEALFNILSVDVVDSTWLDLFAGTGSIGIEALSRGARQVLFIDKGQQAVATVRRNLELTGFAEQSQVLRTDALRFLAQESDRHSFDYIYVAPPQYLELWAETMRLLDQGAPLAADGQVIVQIHPREYHPLALATLRLVDERRYGSTSLLFYERATPDEEASPDAATG